MEVRNIKDESPNQALIDLMENLLNQVKSGEVRSMAYIVSFSDNRTSHGWALDARSHRMPIMGQFLMLQTDMADNIGLEFGDSILSCQFNG